MIDESIRAALFTGIHRGIAESTAAAVSVLGSSEASAITDSPEEFISPMLLYALYGLFFLGVAIIIAATVITLGIIFSATFVGILRRRFSAGVRAFHYQLWAIGGMLTGVFGVWVGSHFFGPPLETNVILLVGSILGVGGGLLLAFAVDQLARIAYKRFVTPTLPNDRNA